MDGSLATVVLKRDREKPVRNRHPWIFSGAVSRIDEGVEDGDLVRVVDGRGAYLATGYLNRRSQILVRLLSWDAGETVDTDFWRRRLERAIASRARLIGDPATDAFRLVHAEADGLPGLIVDCYGDWLVLQCLTLGMARRRDEIVDLLADLSGLGRERTGERLRPPGPGLPAPLGIYARDDADVRHKEGLSPQAGLLWGVELPDRVQIVEHGHRFAVDIKRGQKTGFYLDQRENRLRTAAYCGGVDVLNAFAYTGAFSVYAGKGGARSVVNIDTSAEALALAEENLALNDCAAQQMVVKDVFQALRQYRDEGRTFDLVILDPPKFAVSQTQVMNASRGYKDVNLLAMQLLRPGGLLVTFSCSGLVSADLFQKIVFGASVDADRDVQILDRLFQGSDHPVLVTFPESAYLKGFVCRVW
jgi:23S rRNA (cytosine1962-C5)-methyltransferase